MKLDELGIPVVEHCNLNCKGCLHFCHIGQKPYFCDVDQYKNDLRRLRELFEEIDIIRLYGGEPLLHPNLKEFIEVTNKHFPHTNIEILTNGILIDRMSTDLINSILKCKVKICWSIYPIMDDNIIFAFLDLLNKNGIYYSYNRVKEFYTCFDATGNQNKDEAFEKCSGKYCHVMKNGKISNCPAPMVSHYIKQLGANIDFNDGILDIYKISCGQDILDFIQNPHTACKYCGAPRYFKWERQNGECSLDDWKTLQ